MITIKFETGETLESHPEQGSHLPIYFSGERNGIRTRHTCVAAVWPCQPGRCMSLCEGFR